MSKTFRLFTLLLMVCAATSSFAQPNPHWKKIGQLPEGKYGPVTPTGGHFWSKTRGVVATSDNVKAFDLSWSAKDGTNRIFYTENDNEWHPALLPHYSEHTGRILDLFAMSDSLIYAIIGRVSSPPINNTLWKSTDGGKTWIDSLVPGYMMCIYQSIDGKLRFGRPSVPPVAFGMTWINDSVAVSGLSDEDPNWKTTDGGLTWFDLGYPVTGLPDLLSVLNPYYDRRSELIFGAPHYQQSRGYGPVISPDSGLTWQKYGSWPPDKFGTFEVTGDINGGRDAIYVQSACRGGLYPGADYPESRGLCRTTNSGKTWTNIGGPSNYWTLDFNVVDCIGAVVIAYDSVGGIWMTKDGGDGSLSPYSKPILPQTHQALTANLCDSTWSGFKIENAHCDELIIESVELISDDPRMTSTGALQLSYLPNDSTILAEGGIDSVTFTWSPGLVWQTDSSGNATVRIRYRSKEEGLLRDTIVYLTLGSKRGRFGHKLSVGDIAFAPTSVCGYRDTTIAVVNTGCRDMAYQNAKVSGTGYSIISTPGTFIAPGDTAWITLRFTPVSEIAHNGILTLNWNEQGLTTEDIIYLTGFGGPGEGNLELISSDRIDLPDLQLCAATDTLAILRNTGCDTIIVKNVTLNAASDYALATAINDVVLPPDSSLSFRVSFTPQAKGARNGTVTVTWSDERGNDPRDITISLNATVIDGTRALASSISTLDFGETNICEERDSVVRLTNTGCDTLTITEADIDKNFTLNGDLPIKIAPGESVELPITTQVDTTGKPTRLTGVLAIASNADNQLAPITLTRGLYYPTKLRIEAVDEASGIAGDEARFRIILDGDVLSTMTALHFDFLHNNDLLSFESLSGAGLEVVNTVGDADQRQSFTLSPVRAGVLGELTFRAYLAEAEQTTLSFDNITFEAEGVGFAPECIAVISDSGSRFNYVYTCGDDLIRTALRGETLIKSLTPNPAQNEIRLELADGAGEAEVVIVDMLGKEVLRTMTADRIDVSALITGTYYLRVTASGAVQTRRVIIER